MSLSADYTQLDTEHPTAKLSISTSKPLGSYRVGIYDDTGKLKYTPIWRIALVGTGSPRTWYFGSKSSVFRIVLYEKGKEQLAKGNIADPTWVRLEVRIRPKSTAKELIGEMNLQPSDLLRMSKWGKEVGESLGFLDLDRINIGSVWKPDDEQLLVTKIARLFNGGLGKAYEKMTPVVFGELLYAEFQKQVEISNRLKQLAA